MAGVVHSGPGRGGLRALNAAPLLVLVQIDGKDTTPGTLRASIQAIVAKLRTVASLRAEPWAGESGPRNTAFPGAGVTAS